MDISRIWRDTELRFELRSALHRAVERNETTLSGTHYRRLQRQFAARVGTSQTHGQPRTGQGVESATSREAQAHKQTALRTLSCSGLTMGLTCTNTRRELPLKADDNGSLRVVSLRSTARCRALRSSNRIPVAPYP